MRKETVKDSLLFNISENTRFIVDEASKING
jgi:hypothetical protein